MMDAKLRLLLCSLMCSVVFACSQGNGRDGVGERRTGDVAGGEELNDRLWHCRQQANDCPVEQRHLASGSSPRR